MLSDKIQAPEIMNVPEKMKKCCSLLKLAQEDVHHLYEKWEYLEEKKQKST